MQDPLMEAAERLGVATHSSAGPDLGALLGHLSRYASFAKALAPGCYSALAAAGLTRHASLAALGAVALVGTASYCMAVLRRR